MNNLFVLAGPSGVGKTTLIKRLLKEKPNDIVHPLTYTTRPLRPGEVDGRDMISIPRSQFTPRLLGNQFIAHTEYGGEYYGTLKSDIFSGLNAHKKVIVALDEHGIDCLKHYRYPVVNIWLTPPNEGAISYWLEKRWPNKGEEYEKRFSQAVQEYRRFEVDRDFRKKFDYWMLSRNMDEMVTEMLEIMGLAQ